MPRFLQALKSIATGRAAVKVVEEAPPSAYSAAVALLQELGSSMNQKAILEYFQDYIPAQARTSVSTFLGDKSQSELIFLASILLTVLLFVVILPAYETLFGCDGNDVKDKEEEELSMSPSRMRMYKPGVGVVEMDVGDIAEMTSLIRASSGESTASVGSHGSGSCSMETIEESEEEDLEDEDEDQGGEDQDEVRSIGEASEKVNSTDEPEGVLFTEDEGVDYKMEQKVIPREGATMTQRYYPKKTMAKTTKVVQKGPHPLDHKHKRPARSLRHLHHLLHLNEQAVSQRTTICDQVSRMSQ